MVLYRCILLPVVTKLDRPVPAVLPKLIEPNFHQNRTASAKFGRTVSIGGIRPYFCHLI
jgi:hypothetical protein